MAYSDKPLLVEAFRTRPDWGADSLDTMIFTLPALHHLARHVHRAVKFYGFVLLYGDLFCGFDEGGKNSPTRRTVSPPE